MAERDDEVWLERALDDKRRSADVSSPPAGGFADVQLRCAQRRRQRRRETVIALAASVATLAALGTAGWWLWPAADDLSTTGPATPLAAGPGPAGTSPPPSSGGTVTMVAEEDARVRELGDRIFAVDDGTVWFAVDPGSGRLEVRSPDRTVVVLGTVFAVRVDATAGASGTTVGVLCGRVRVESPGENVVELAAGQQLPPGAAAALPLDTAWRARMTSLFPERAAREASLPAPRGTIVAGKTQAGPAASGDAPSAGLPAVAPSPTTVVANAPSPSPASGNTTTAPAANPPPATGTPDATVGQGAVAAEPPAGTVASALPPPAPYTGPDLRSTPTWRDLYQQAWIRLPTDPEGTASAIEVLVESAPSRAEAEEAMLALASIYHDNLRHFARSRTVYERYLARFPSGSHRRDVWMRLCLAYGETGDADKQRLCLRAFAVEFPEAGR
jgi:hypothetical protein